MPLTAGGVSTSTSLQPRARSGEAGAKVRVRPGQYR